MKIVKANPENKSEKTVKLSELANGSVFRFLDTTFEKALSVEDGSFYMVVNKPASNAERVSLISLDGRSFIERDGSHLVIPHQATISVSANI